jgi:hypothetical protein
MTFGIRFSVLFFIVFMYGSCAIQETDLPQNSCNQPVLEVNKSVEAVAKNANSVVSQYKYDDIIEGYVVSTDEFGNFYKTLSIQTLATATVPAIGFSVPVDVTNIYVDYRLGNKVYFKLKNQYSDIYYGGLRLGSIYVNAFNEASVGRLSQNEYKNVLQSSCTTFVENKLTQSISIPELIQDSKLNTLVELNDVQFEEAAMGRHFYEETNDVGGGTNWNLIDKNGNQIYLRTSSFARFSSKEIPAGKGKVRGVLTKFGTDYQLIPRSEKDIEMNEKRRAPFFTEDFQLAVDNSNVSLPGWANIVQDGSLFWKGAAYNGNTCAEYAISGTKVNLNTGWLISPKIDMDTHTNEILTFRIAQHHLDVDSPLNSVELYVSTNFDGINISQATWTKIPFILPKQATAWYQFIGSGGIDLSSYKGKINIGFKYIGSGKNTALDGAFQIDDVQIFGDK